ncbi:MAG: GNAT family N-acetyltransferase, partial [Thermoplasmata archaeon]|nr:GNAT family N-acetyltransferase [Thermoplasmata archaeon]
ALYLVCLEDWSEEMKEAGNRKSVWFERMSSMGLRVKLAKADDGRIGGMIQYLPIEHSNALGQDSYFILCIWVHGHKEGRGNFQKKGMGKALLKAAEEDAKSLGAKSMTAWGLTIPVWMKAYWFKKQGYEVADKNGVALLMWKPFVEGARPPKWIKEKKRPGTIPGKVSVTVFSNGWCQVINIVAERAKRAAEELGEKVVYSEMDTTDRAVLREWGISDALFIDAKEVRTGPPPSYEKIKKKIAKRVKKLR